MTLNKLKRLWKQGRDIPIRTDDETIDEKWHIWDKGTAVLDIWHWFDDELGKINRYYILNDLMFNKIQGLYAVIEFYFGERNET